MLLRQCMVLMMVLLCGADAVTDLRVGFILLGNISDFGWTYAINNARISTQDYLKSKGTNIKVTLVESVNVSASTEVMNNLASGPVPHQLIVASSFSLQDQTFAAAKRNPNTNFLHISGYKTGQPNFITAFGKLYQARYLSGVAAGSTTTTKRIGYIASIPIAEVFRNINAFYLGAQVGAGAKLPEEGSNEVIEERVEVLVIWLGTFFDPDREEEATRRLVLLGCDVAAYHTDSNRVPLYMKHHGLHSVGSSGDIRRIVGESVLTSASLSWAPIFLDMILASINSTFTLPSQPHSLWYDYEQRVPTNHDLSNDVPEIGVQLFDREQQKLFGKWDPFCIPIHRSGRRVQTNRCLSDSELLGMDFLMDGVQVVDFKGHHGEVCGAGEEMHLTISQSPPVYNVTCSVCPKGSFSSMPNIIAGPTDCKLCPEGSYSNSDRSSECILCQGGTSNIGEGNTGCIKPASDNTTFIIIISVVAGAIMIIVPIVAWKVKRDRNTMKWLYSNNAVAESCAESIAAMQLEEVSYIMDIKSPNRIQKAFIKIIKNLTEYRRYLPQSIINGDTSDSGSSRGSGSLKKSRSRAASNQNSSLNGRSQRSNNTGIMCRDVKNDLGSALTLRSTTLTSLLFKGFPEWCAATISRDSESKEAAIGKIATLCDVILSCCQKTKGQLHDLNPGNGHFVVLWNKKSVAEGAASFALNCIESLAPYERSNDIPQLDYGLAITYHKVSWYGNLGGEIRTPSLINLQSDWISILHNCGFHHRLPIVTSCSDLNLTHVMTPIDAFNRSHVVYNIAGNQYSSDISWQVVKVYQLKAAHQEQEWMYNVTSDEKLDELFEKYSGGDVVGAKELLKDVSSEEDRERFTSVMSGTVKASKNPFTNTKVVLL